MQERYQCYLIWFLTILLLIGIITMWGGAILHDVMARFKKSVSKDELLLSCGKKEPCDENKILLQLARLYITSPERIVLLLTMDCASDTCQDVEDVLMHINGTLATCTIKPNSQNLYIKLYQGLCYYNWYICGYKEKSKVKHILNYEECLKELREDLIECEGPPDWFERTNSTIVCAYYNEVANCNYIRTAQLCGLKAGFMLRGFTVEVMKRVVMQKCEVSRSLPAIDNPMQCKGSYLHVQHHYFLMIYTIFYFFFIYLLSI